MLNVSLFDLASRQAIWLTARQAAIAANVANVNTPRFKAIDVAPFEAVLNGGASRLRATHASHIGGDGGASGVVEPKVRTLAAGQSVEIEKELTKAGEVQRAYDLNAAVVKSFHKMILSTVRN